MEVVQEARAPAELSHLLEMRNISKRFGGTISYGGRDFTDSPRQMPVTFIHQDLGLIVVFTDLEEVANVCHRALVFDRGKVVADLDDEQLSVGSVLAATSSCLCHSDALAASQW
jgi:hypothetical protein